MPFSYFCLHTDPSQPLQMSTTSLVESITTMSSGSSLTSSSMYRSMSSSMYSTSAASFQSFESSRWFSASSVSLQPLPQRMANRVEAFLLGLQKGRIGDGCCYCWKHGICGHALNHRSTYCVGWIRNSYISVEEERVEKISNWFWYTKVITASTDFLSWSPPCVWTRLTFSLIHKQDDFVPSGTALESVKTDDFHSKQTFFDIFLHLGHHAIVGPLLTRKSAELSSG